MRTPGVDSNTKKQDLAGLDFFIIEIAFAYMDKKDQNSASCGIKTDEKKQHFDDIYIAEDPVPFKEKIIDALDYISDDFNRAIFDRLILSWCEKRVEAGEKLHLVDLCCCFGNTTMAIAHGMDVADIRANWADHESCRKAAQPRRLPLHTTGIDISRNAVAYGKQAGIFDEAIEADLNAPAPGAKDAVYNSMRAADVVVSTASLVYLEPHAIAAVRDAFAEGEGEGYMLVNFLNPFSLEKSDTAKRILLEKLDFVGSMATRHRRLSRLERENYPDEEWALLELWVLKRRG